jgi:hypothetical protein
MNPYAPPREAELDGVDATRSISSASILLRLAARGLDVGLGSLVAAPLALLFSSAVSCRWSRSWLARCLAVWPWAPSPA